MKGAREVLLPFLTLFLTAGAGSQRTAAWGPLSLRGEALQLPALSRSLEGKSHTPSPVESHRHSSPWVVDGSSLFRGESFTTPHGLGKTTP